MKMPCDVSTAENPAMFGSRSLHPGGVNAAMGDASVRFVSESIDLNVWRFMSTAAGGEVFDIQ
jgi:prepilin-type processing-associated H-X9-DG protein